MGQSDTLLLVQSVFQVVPAVSMPVEVEIKTKVVDRLWWLPVSTGTTVAIVFVKVWVLTSPLSCHVNYGRENIMTQSTYSPDSVMVVSDNIVDVVHVSTRVVVGSGCDVFQVDKLACAMAARAASEAERASFMVTVGELDKCWW